MQPRPSIMVVDDQADIRELTALLLEGAGYDVVAKPSGADALRHLVAHSCQLVLLDINMPEMDGWETLRLIRADDSLADLPVVMFSVKDRIHDRVLGMQEGAVDYITKPFEVDQLLYRVRRVLEARRGGPRPPTSQPVA
ncbi:MAG TPA: response regulator [Candidatus Polarisedimenticolaceae bacterium]|nr:response regulator [Candidatus Polarisedimenticolaceae bacterium]